MGEFCPWCGVTMQGEGPTACVGRFACSERKAFEEGQEAGYDAASLMIGDERDRARVVARGLLQRLGFERDHPIIKELAAEIDGWRS